MEDWQWLLALRKEERPTIPDDISPTMMELGNIARKCWSEKPEDRPQLSEVLARLNAFA